jgi:hypothetical protein
MRDQRARRTHGYNPLAANRGETQIFRAMFLTPFQIPTALGLPHVKSPLDHGVGRSGSAGAVVFLAIALLFSAILSGAFRALFSLPSDPHNYPNPLAHDGASSCQVLERLKNVGRFCLSGRQQLTRSVPLRRAGPILANFVPSPAQEYFVLDAEQAIFPSLLGRALSVLERQCVKHD